ncbi:MAG: sodium ion-translocating decarboxylase subunit beta, partial [Negativicutes bacterium]|nr:sodium ion-translocating decarboxylase subunit beta [Negativicutes bacterium]
MGRLHELLAATGVAGMTGGELLMTAVCLGLIYLAVARGFEPLLLLPIGFGGLLANVPLLDIAGSGFLAVIYGFGVATGLFPLLIFLGVGALTDFGPLIANPRTALLGGAAQLGIFAALSGT